MATQVFIVAGLLVLSIVSGMLGLGVAFAAVPFLGLFLPDLVHQVQPLSLLLNGLTALASTFGFARSGYVEWRRAGLLAVVTTAFAPAGAVVAHRVPQVWIWSIYFLAAAYMAYRLFRPVTERPGHERSSALAKNDPLVLSRIDPSSSSAEGGPGRRKTVCVRRFEPRRCGRRAGIGGSRFREQPGSFLASA